MDMNFITVTTPENIEIKYRLAGLGSRVAAAFIDFCVIVSAILLVAVTVFFAVYGGQFDLIRIYGWNGWVTGLAIIIGFSVYFGYFIISELTMKGQSIGKKILKLRVIRQNGQPVTFFPSLVRNLFRYFLDIYGVGVVFILLNSKHKRIGDIVAGTVVVSENLSRIQTKDLAASLLADGLQSADGVAISGKYSLTEDELVLLKAYFSRKSELLDGGLQAGEKLTGYFSKKFDIEKGRLNDAGLEKIMLLNIRAARY